MGNHKRKVQAFLAVSLIQYRDRRGVSQEQMAERLYISPRGYGDLERNKYCMSLMVFVWFILAMTDEERVKLFNELHRILWPDNANRLPERL